ncbi:MAG: NGG1p interacting factor NIF3 [Candidatus Saccharicenans sp.]|nr:MAG: NGG1p interacting factor NIF3 [Candidatus Aminicenantes bacterium]HEK86738.1 NGG1p interacting factor NIF3 [Candidatus Aminicenantes bacterium]
MKLKDLYHQAIEIGLKNDLRPKEEIERLLKEEKEKYGKLSEKEKEKFDLDRLFNPYADSRVLNGDLETEIKRAVAGIDMEVGEILLTYVLNLSSSEKIDLVISHHPEGRALAQLYQVMKLQIDLLTEAGVTPSVAEQLMEKRIGEVERRLLPINHHRAVDAARVLNLPFICLHTPADNCVTRYLTELFEKKKPFRLKEIINLLEEIPEYQKSIRLGICPKILSGSEDSRAGKIYVDMTGGTEGSKDIFEKQAAAGLSTLVGMHFSEEALEMAKKANLNIIVAGHIASDTLGLNLLLDQVEKELGEKLEIMGLSGFERIRHM